MTDQPHPAYPGFQGTVGRTFASSTPSWPPRTTPRQGSPNVVIILVDDLGFSDISCYGSEIPTPNIDALATSGLRYTNFHVTPLCSPTRAALLTGLNSHAAGMGMVANVDPGFPGYTCELPAHQPSMAEMFRANGYRTLMVGKWHLCKDTDLHEAGDRHSWPLQRGFDEYYGVMEALTNFHHPHRMYEGNSAVSVDQYPDGYYVTDDLTDRAITMMRGVKTANPSLPFFLYFAHLAVHAPLHAKPDAIARQRGRYAMGWDALRKERLARQIELGIMPPGTVLPPRNTELHEDVVAWDTLSADQKSVFARYMEVYAAMVESVDESVGRVRAALEELGELDNTVMLFMSDNGASREGRDSGTTAYFRDGGTGAAGSMPVTAADVANIDAIGGPTTWPHYPRGWAMACNTPFRLYKITTHRGGHNVPLLLSWPASPGAAGELARRQYTHVTDLMPTLSDMLGLTMLTERHGKPAEPIAGRSFAATRTDPAHPSQHTTQYYECIGHRGYYRDGWEVVTFHPNRTPFSQDRWELYHVEADLNQLHDLADAHPDMVTELVQAWEDDALANRVFPLDEGSLLNLLLRPPTDQVYSQPVTIHAGTPTLERVRSARLIGGRSFRMAVDWQFRSGDEGVLVAHGGQEAGYVLYVEDDSLFFAMNEFGRPIESPGIRLPETCASVVVHVHAPGKAQWDVTIDVDGTTMFQRDGYRQLAGFLPFEGIDVGIDRRSPVLWSLYERRGAFPFTGTLRSVTFTPGAFAPDAGPMMIEKAREFGLRME